MPHDMQPDPARNPLPDSYDGLRKLQDEFHRYQAAAFPERPPRFFALELAGETGELANLEKKVWKGRQVAADDFEDESADVCIALLNYANSRGIDLARAVEEKMRRIDARRLAEPEAPGEPEER
jgi:NTP pyrophosphatase (non-canonical NTP hydrolase)